MHIQCDGAALAQSITLVTIGNGRCSGGGFWLTPEALLEDGLFDVCIVRGLNKPQILALAPEVMKGTHITRESVRMSRAHRIVITSEAPLPMHADGEIIYTDAHRIEAELLPGQLNVVV